MLADILYFLAGVIVGGIGGFFLAKYFIQKYMKENPPINEQMIKTMMQQMGRTPSQKQIKQMMKAMEKHL